MTASLEDILSRVADGSLVPADYYRALDRDAALDARDSDEDFESAWLTLRERIEAAWASSRVSDVEGDAVERIRREAFSAVSRATSQHELAGYVSDDLDLIARGRVLSIDEPLLSWLWASYDQG